MLLGSKAVGSGLKGFGLRKVSVFRCQENQGLEDLKIEP
jgi:hypothetical protein